VDADGLKREAALAAVRHVQPGMRVGLGTGSTARHAIIEIGRLVREGALAGLVGVPTSLASEALAREHGIPLVDLDGELDVTIDGADEIALNLDAIKGLGGALVREKIVAYHTRTFVLVADDSKRVTLIGEKAPVPVEVVPFATRATRRAIDALGAETTWRSRDGHQVRSDNGNPILDCRFAPTANPRSVEESLRSVPGVVGTGLFLGMAAVAYIAAPGGVERLERP
jgi:ribose 5-phosphate isomerase A